MLMLRVLELLEYNTYCSYRIQQKANISGGTVIVILDKLYSEGLLKITRKKSAANYTVMAYGLTQKGRKALEEWKIIKELFGVKELKELC